MLQALFALIFNVLLAILPESFEAVGLETTNLNEAMEATDLGESEEVSEELEYATCVHPQQDQNSGSM